METNPITSDNKSRSNKKVLIGTVSSDKMNKTAVVTVEKRLKHKLYGKYIIKNKNYKIHDEKNECKVGDIVKIIECRPYSKDKRWRYIETIRKAVI
ncbi:MAG: 30S ribosomal protein S17 [Spirochaetota bacterium]